MTRRDVKCALAIIEQYCREHLPEVADISGDITRRGDQFSLEWRATGQNTAGSLFKAIEHEKKFGYSTREEMTNAD